MGCLRILLSLCLRELVLLKYLFLPRLTPAAKMPCGERPLEWQQDGGGGLGHTGDLPHAGQIPSSPESFFFS